MPSIESRVIIACAGSGKTTRLVAEALANRDRRIAIVTYTNNNTREISKRFGDLNSGMPKHVNVMTWFAFLLRECARPYQRSKYAERRIESLLFVNQQSARYVSESETRRHYFANDELIYSDKIAKFVVECEKKSSRRVTARLGQMYTDVFIDEFQDLAGWDLEVIQLLLQSGVRVTLVGDPRQHIYSTNPSQKNKQYLGIGVVKLLEQWKRAGLCSVERMNDTHRCQGAICDFTNALWPGMDAILIVDPGDPMSRYFDQTPKEIQEGQTVRQFIPLKNLEAHEVEYFYVTDTLNREWKSPPDPLAKAGKPSRGRG